MIAFLQNLQPVTQALVATSFTWAVTALGAATVFAARDVSKRVLDTMLGFAGGVMIAASH
jgi:ZIP family zinc transporter